MAKISEREKVLLGYSPSKCSISSSRRNSEVDFSDVFGGPPRCSAQDHYYDEPDCVDDGDDSCGFRSSLQGRPIFGDQVGPRMRYPSHDFYGDIFGGDQPLLSCSVPVRKQFASAPGSRDISPSRRLPNAAPQISTSPSNFSQPEKTSNTDYTTSTSMNQISKSPGRSLSRLSQTLQRLSVYRPSSLSRQISSDAKESTTTTQYNPTSVRFEEGKLYATLPSKDSISNEKFNGAEYEAELIMNSNDNIRFHFSIHRWANKGVPISISSRKRSQLRSNNDILVMKNKTPVLISSSPFSSLCESFLQDDHATIEDDLPSTTQVSEEAWFDDLNVGIKNVTMSENNGDLSDQNVFKSMSNGSEISGDVHGPSQKCLDDTTTVNVSTNVTKSSTRPLASSFANGNEEDKSFEESKRKETKKQVLDDIFSSILDDMDEDTITLEAKNDSNDNMQASSFRLGRTLSDSIEMVDTEPYILEQQYIVNDNGYVSEPDIESTKAPPPNPIDVQEVDESIQNKSTQLTTESEDETQSYERKVKQWSKGKEGNIRALLSTLQYVLWPNSGWKPIPLVDIIEGAAVKRSYQRALLCLHPDKLQQKGASPYEKFIAERVFDILQVAWDQFNSLGLL